MIVTDERQRRKDWARIASAKLHGRRHRPPPQPTGTQSYTPDAEAADESDLAERRALAQPNQQPTPQERRDAHVERWIYPWAYAVCLRAKSIRDSRRFNDHVDLLTARAECDPYMEDEQERLLLDDEIELPEDPHEHYRAALSEWGRARHLRKIFRLTGTYPTDTGDMTTGEVYSWYMELHDAVASYKNAIGV